MPPHVPQNYEEWNMPRFPSRHSGYKHVENTSGRTSEARILVANWWSGRRVAGNHFKAVPYAPACLARGCSHPHRPEAPVRGGGGPPDALLRYLSLPSPPAALPQPEGKASQGPPGPVGPTGRLDLGTGTGPGPEGRHGLPGREVGPVPHKPPGQQAPGLSEGWAARPRRPQVWFTWPTPRDAGLLQPCLWLLPLHLLGASCGRGGQWRWWGWGISVCRQENTIRPRLAPILPPPHLALRPGGKLRPKWVSTCPRSPHTQVCSNGGTGTSIFSLAFKTSHPLINCSNNCYSSCS